MLKTERDYFPKALNGKKQTQKELRLYKLDTTQKGQNFVE